MSNNNNNLFNAAIAGIGAGVLTSVAPNDSTATDYLNLSNCINAAAVAVDAAIAPGTFTTAQASLLEGLCNGIFSQRSVTSTLSTTYTSIAAVIGALFTELSLKLVAGSGSVAATDVSYSPAIPSNWGATPPTNAGAALDDLASITASQQAAGALGPSQTISFNANFNAVKSGWMYIIGVISGTSNQAGTQAAALLMDGVSIAQSITGTGNGNEWQCVLVAVTQVTLGAHTIQINSAINAGTNSSSAGQTKVAYQELL